MLMGGFQRAEPQPHVEDDSTSDDIEAELAAYSRPAQRKPLKQNMKVDCTFNLCIDFRILRVLIFRWIYKSYKPHK